LFESRPQDGFFIEITNGGEWFDYYHKSNKPKDKIPEKYLEIEEK